ncbi:MAG: DNA repair protein RecN [Nitrospinae bacterium RIFCSPLOWO2_12_39_16]|nr:MAG: DNA repair protein RecN [Nitrospinae bacterium RIFCSPLOWO2_12_39_16]
MLKELRIKNYAIIDELSIDFKAGLNILTGETGAGKSIIIESLGLILGERASDESIRSGEDSAAVEAVYDISKIKNIKEKLSESGIETENNELIIRRQISRSGKNRSYINNSAVNLSLLKDIGDMLVDIHGQHEHQTLLHPENHSIVLDLFGNILPLREKCRENYSNLQNLQREVNELINKERERVQKIDLLNFQKEEIDKAELNTDEDEELKREKNLIQNAERLHRYATESYDILYSSEGSVTEKLNTVITAIGELSRIDSSTEKILNDGREVLFQIEDLASRIRDYSDKIEFNPNRLSEIDDRLAEITALKRKYGANIEDILNYRKKIDEDLEILSKSQERMDRLTTEIEKLKKEMEDTLMKLAREREKASDRFESMIEKELKELKMEKVRFKVEFFYEEDDSSFIKYKGKPVKFFPEGIGKIEFFFSPNIGEDLKPLSKIASGGELSRVMLSIKNILTNKDSIPVLIFDEVDAGIGGGVAEVVGEKLKKVSKGRQVFCITHLPQIASRADTHFQIAKKTSNGRTITSIKELKGEERVEEIARMAGGKIITDTVRRHAEEMIMKGDKIN